jgi:hypothetical protein
MQDVQHSEDLGQELGYDGVDGLVDQVEAVCVRERRRIELTNEPTIVRLQMELAMWRDEERRVSERLRLAPPSGDFRLRRLEARFSTGFAFVLTVAGFFFSLLALDPYRLGWKSYLYCAGVALACPYGVHKCIKEWDCRRLIRVLSALAGVAALASLVLLAVIRGSLFAHEIKDAESQMVITDDSATAPLDGNDFYKETLPQLQLAMALLAVAMELEAGLALYDARQLSSDSDEDREEIAKQLMALRTQMASVGSQIVEHSNEASAFEARFWRDFYRAMLTRTTKKALGKLLALSLFMSFVCAGAARAQQQSISLVVAVDLSASVAAKGPDGRTDFEKDAAAVGELLAHVPAGSRIAILGITGNSFGEPDILLQANVPQDSGYFGEKLGAAHKELVKAWWAKASHLAPSAKQTDILGALSLAEQFFHEVPNGRKVLVIYSDMRQATPELNLEGRSASKRKTLAQEVTGPMPDLAGVEVYALGVDATVSGSAAWQRLKLYWTMYFKAAGSNLQAYLVLRDAPVL